MRVYVTVKVFGRDYLERPFCGTIAVLVDASTESLAKAHSYLGMASVLAAIHRGLSVTENFRVELVTSYNIPHEACRVVKPLLENLDAVKCDYRWEACIETTDRKGGA